MQTYRIVTLTDNVIDMKVCAVQDDILYPTCTRGNSIIQVLIKFCKSTIRKVHVAFNKMFKAFMNQSINHGFHIHQGLWRPWTATDHDLVPFEPQ